jgi:hypothetical protein
MPIFGQAAISQMLFHEHSEAFYQSMCLHFNLNALQFDKL